MFETKDFKFKLDDTDDEQGTFTGYASIFDAIDSYNEMVLKGAFRKTLKENDGKFPLCWFHNIAEPLGIIYAKEKSQGLATEGHLNLDVQSAREKRSLMKQDVITGMSIGFKTLQDEWDEEVRKIKEVKLYEISLITRNFQACPGAEIENIKGDIPEEFKPYPNEHSARLQSPNKFDKFRRKADGKLYNKISIPSTIDQIWGHLKGKDDNSWATQALRFPIKNWTAAEAKKWLKDNDIKYTSFEPASKSLEGVLNRIITIETADNLSKESVVLIKESITHLQTLLEEKEPLPIGTLGPLLEPSFEGLTSELRKLKSLFGGN